MVSQMCGYRFQSDDYWIKTPQNLFQYGLNQNSCALLNPKVKYFHPFVDTEKDTKKLENDLL